MKQLSKLAAEVLGELRAGKSVVPFHGMDNPLIEAMSEVIRHLGGFDVAVIPVNPQILAFRSWVAEFGHVLFEDCQLPATEQKVIAVGGLGYYAAWCIKLSDQQL